MNIDKTNQTKQVSTDIIKPYLSWLESKIYNVNAQYLVDTPFVFKDEIESGFKEIFGASMPANVLYSELALSFANDNLLELSLPQLKFIRDYTI